MEAACIFIDKTFADFCIDFLNNEEGLEQDIDYTKIDDPVYKIIRNNMIQDGYFCILKFSEFLLNESKHDDIKLALNELEKYGMDLRYCWDNTMEDVDTIYVKGKILTRKEKYISYLISIGDIRTFNDLFDAFEPYVDDSPNDTYQLANRELRQLQTEVRKMRRRRRRRI